jgi:chromosome segregation ATPase
MSETKTEEIPDVNEEEDLEVVDSVAFSLIEDLTRQRKLTTEEGDFFRSRYRKVYEIVSVCKKRDNLLTKKISNLSNEILTEKINFEKVKAEESDQMKSLVKLEQERVVVQKDLDFASQRDIMAKFELAEFRKVHSELNRSLERMTNENRSLVEPVINGLTTQISELTRDLDEAETAHMRELEQKKSLDQKLEEMNLLRQNETNDHTELQEEVGKKRTEPNRLIRQAESIEKAASAMDEELRSILRKIKRADEDLEKQNKKMHESEKLRLNLNEKLEFHRQTLMQRENDAGLIRKQLENEKARNHDLVTVKVELNLLVKELEGDLRHKTDRINFLKKDYDSLKRVYKKKRGGTDQVKQIIPQLEEQTADQSYVMRSFKDEETQIKKKINVHKDEVDSQLAVLLHSEGVEKSTKEVSTCIIIIIIYII